MASSKKWAKVISSIASCTYFLVIISQIPLFRVSCRTGICTTPIEVTSSQLLASEIFPAVAVKALLYPGAVANAIMKNSTIPSYNNLLKFHKLINVKNAPATSDLQRLEVCVLAGCYFSVAGALLGLIKPGRLSFFGTLLVLWGLVKELNLRKYANAYHIKSVCIYPTMSIAVVLSFLSIKGDVRKIIRSCKAPRVNKSLRR